MIIHSPSLTFPKTSWSPLIWLKIPAQVLTGSRVKLQRQNNKPKSPKC